MGCKLHPLSAVGNVCDNFKMPYFLTDLFSCGAKPEAGTHDLVVYTLYGQLIKHKVNFFGHMFTLCNCQFKYEIIFSFCSPFVQQQCKKYHPHPTAKKAVFYSHDISHSKCWHPILSKFSMISIPKYPWFNYIKTSLNC